MRRAVFIITDDILIDFLSYVKDPNTFKKTWSVIKNPLPDDVEPVKSYIGNFGNINIVLQSDSFEDIESGELFPILKPPVFHVERKDE